MTRDPKTGPWPDRQGGLKNAARVFCGLVLRINRQVHRIVNSRDRWASEVSQRQNFFVISKVAPVINRRVLSKWHIEFARAIESAEAVVASSIQVIKK